MTLFEHLAELRGRLFKAALAIVAGVVVAWFFHGTLFHLRVKGIDPAVAGHSYGAHLHVGPCVAGDGAAAGPHYNVSTNTPPLVSDQTEVWLDFTATAGGTGAADTTVPFLPASGARSVVIHAEPTAPNGTAGARLVCLPVVW